jgi:hypothetical protein
VRKSWLWFASLVEDPHQTAAPAADPVGPEPSREPSPVAAPGDFHACAADSDCIVHCPELADCCGWPCGCTNAIHVAQREAFDAHYAATCETHPDCPAVACAFEQHHYARCVDQRCRAFEGLGF